MIVYMNTHWHMSSIYMQIHHHTAAVQRAICDNACFSKRVYAVQTMEEINVHCTSMHCVQVIQQLNPFLSIFVKGQLFSP